MKETCDHFNQLLNQKKYKKLIEHTSLYLMVNKAHSLIYCYRAYARSQMKNLMDAYNDYSEASELFKREIGCFDFHISLIYADDRINKLWKSWYQTYMSKKNIQQMKNLYKANRLTLFSKQKSFQYALEPISESPEEEDKINEKREFN